MYGTAYKYTSDTSGFTPTTAAPLSKNLPFFGYVGGLAFGGCHAQPVYGVFADQVGHRFDGPLHDGAAERQRLEFLGTSGGDRANPAGFGCLLGPFQGLAQSAQRPLRHQPQPEGRCGSAVRHAELYARCSRRRTGRDALGKPDARGNGFFRSRNVASRVETTDRRLRRVGDRIVERAEQTEGVAPA